jgi:hypothetical protein
MPVDHAQDLRAPEPKTREYFLGLLERSAVPLGEQGVCLVCIYTQKALAFKDFLPDDAVTGLEPRHGLGQRCRCFRRIPGLSRHLDACTRFNEDRNLLKIRFLESAP